MFLKTVSMGQRIVLILIGLSFGAILLYLFHDPIWQVSRRFYFLLTDRDRAEAFIASFGWASPLVFMGIQIIQVLLAPIPGEATGFIGGYLFGAIHGFFYSSLALGIGSWFNFMIGRILGDRYVRRIISPQKFAKLDRLVRRQGVIVIFFLFIFPGFPKDWLCLFLGITSLPIKVFILMATLGRMPGTLLLSLQGELLFEKNYILLVPFLVVTLLCAIVAYFYREKLYMWIEKSNHARHVHKGCDQQNSSN